MQLYPPKHGAATAGEIVKASDYINNRFSCDHIRISTISTNGGQGIKKIFNFFRIYFHVIRLFQKNKYDLVYLAPTAAGYKFYKDFILCITAKFFCKKVIYHFHNKGISVNRFVPPFVMKFYFTDVDVILSSPLLKYDILNYVSDNHILYCPYGIPDEKPINYQKTNPKCSILFFANMIIEKGVFDLLNACLILDKKGIDFICNFVGSWYDIKQTEFIRFITKNNLTNKVFFLGAQYNEDKNKVLAYTDIFAFPTFYSDECFPLGILEAFRWNLPVITTYEGAISEIVEDGVNGFLVPQRNVEILAEKIELLIKNPELCQQMGNAGRRKYENEYTLSRFEKRIAEILLHVIDKN
jgi:glycosyltransferase involved in cell wall biosynthesis